MFFQSHSRVGLAVTLLLIAWTFFLLYRNLYSNHSVQNNNKFDLTQYSRSLLGAGVGNSTLGFQKIFVINAPWRTDRKDSISLAASYTGLELSWIDGVAGKDIDEKAFPPGTSRNLPIGNKGSWRAHMNALRTIIEQNLTTALILEDDADWDFRLKSQLSEVSVAAKSLPTLLAESKGNPDSGQERLSDVEIAKRSSIYHKTLARGKENDYGRDWDVLWLGHCGAKLPPPSPDRPNRIVLPDDVTVPEPQHLKPMRNADLDEIGHVYPPHTRVVHQANKNVCTIAYAVTQIGARKLLYEFGIREFSKGYDFALSDFCDGLTRAEKESRPLCLTVQPPIFSHHFPLKMNSDITGHGPGYVAAMETRYVRWSVMMNLERLVKGEEEIEEQWADSNA